MGKGIIYLLAMILLAVVAQAANVGVVVLLADGTIYTDCVTINDGQSAYDAFQKTTLDMVWQNFGFGYFLESVEGVASDAGAGKYWSFWHIDSAGTDFEAAMVGASDYEISTDDKVIGLSYTAFDASFNPITNPPFYGYDNLCPNKMSVSKVQAVVDSDSESVDEGDRIEVKPGSKLVIVIKIKNLDEELELENVEVEGVIEEIDDGDNLEAESDSVDIDEDEKEEVELEFDIPLDADDDEYDLILTITGEGELPYREIITYEVEVEKEKHELVTKVPDSKSVSCGGYITMDVKVSNIGQEDEEVTIQVTNADLSVDLVRDLELDEADIETKSFTVRVPSTAEGEYVLETIVSYYDETDTHHTTLTVDCEEEEQTNVQQTLFGREESSFQEDSEFTEEKENIKGSINVSYIALLIIVNVVLISLITFLVRK